MYDDQPVDVSGGLVARIMRAVRWVEQTWGQGHPPTDQGQILPPPPWWYGKLSADLDAGATTAVDCQRWIWNAESSDWEASTDDPIKVWPSPQLESGTITSGKWVKVEWHSQAQHWIVTEWTCE